MNIKQDYADYVKYRYGNQFLLPSQSREVEQAFLAGVFSLNVHQESPDEELDLQIQRRLMELDTGQKPTFTPEQSAQFAPGKHKFGIFRPDVDRAGGGANDSPQADKSHTEPNRP